MDLAKLSLLKLNATTVDKGPHRLKPTIVVTMMQEGAAENTTEITFIVTCRYSTDYFLIYKKGKIRAYFYNFTLLLSGPITQTFTGYKNINVPVKVKPIISLDSLNPKDIIDVVVCYESRSYYIHQAVCNVMKAYTSSDRKEDISKLYGENFKDIQQRFVEGLKVEKEDEEKEDGEDKDKKYEETEQEKYKWDWGFME